MSKPIDEMEEKPTSRKLASIRIIKELLPIAGADNIEIAIIDGWQCVVKKGDFIVGDQCMYFEIDSLLPIKEQYEFLRKSSYKKYKKPDGDIVEGFRIKTMKLRGQLSQGLALRPYDVFESEHYDDYPINVGDECMIGMDCSEILGVTLYEKPIPAQMVGIAKGNFPSFIRKTDQERVQNVWGEVKALNTEWEVTAKLDGTSCTFYYNDGVFGVCSRNIELIEDENNIYWKMAKKYDVETILREYGQNIAFQGEIIGEGIQGNPCGIKGQDFFLFDIWDIDKQEYLSSDGRSNINRMIVETNHVPAIYHNYNLDNFKSVKDIISFCEYECSIYPNERNIPYTYIESIEGLVFKSADGKHSFKVISNEYLLKEKD